MGENRKTVGRDHHIEAFTMWMAGDGLKSDYIHGQTDELGFGVVDGKVHVHDLHAEPHSATTSRRKRRGATTLTDAVLLPS